MKIVCAWCGKEIGEKPPYEDKSVTHGICDICVTKFFPHQAEKIVEFLGDEKERAGKEENPVTSKSRLFLEESAKYIVSSGRQSISEEELAIIAATVGLEEKELEEATAFMQSDEGREAFKIIIRTELWKAGYRPGEE